MPSQATRLDELHAASGADIRPNLLRVLTDLYVQKAVHTAEEARHYTELALRLLDVVDLPVRVAVAIKLAAYDAAPVAVLRRLTRDVIEVAAPVLALTPVLSRDELVMIAEAYGPPYAAAVASRAEFSALMGVKTVDSMPDVVETGEQAGSLSELVFAADSEERRLILLNLDYAPIPPAQPVAAALARDPIRKLEQAALLRNMGDFARITEDTLGLSREQAARITEDRSGETIVVVAKALSMPADVLQRILLLLNPAIGQSVQRVYDLAELHNEMTQDAALRLLAIWQETELHDRAHVKHRALHVDDDTAGARAITEHPARPDMAIDTPRVTAAGA